MYPFDIAKRAMFIILNASLWNSQAGLSANAIRVVVKANIDLLIDAPIMTLVGKCTAPPKYLPAVSKTLKSKAIKMKNHESLS